MIDLTGLVGIMDCLAIKYCYFYKKRNNKMNCGKQYNLTFVSR